MLIQPAKLLSLALCLSAMVGCGGAESVSGKVTLDGAPLSGAYVTIAYASPKEGIPANAPPDVTGPFVGTTDEEGQFSLGPIGDAGGGAPAGEYTLAITTSHVESFDENTVIPPERVPEPHNTGVPFTVPDGGTNTANFDLTSK